MLGAHERHLELVFENGTRFIRVVDRSTKKISCLCSTSATSLLGVRIFFFSILKPNDIFCDCGMNADARVKKFFSDTAFHGDADALSDLTGVRGSDVEADHSVVVSFIDEDLHIAVTLGAHLVQSPFERLKLGMIGSDVVSSIECLCIFLAQTA